MLKVKLPEIKYDNLAGIDMGIKTFATLSNGEKVDNESILNKLEKKLKRIQKGLSRKPKGSKNKEKQRKKLNKFHKKIRNTRNDFLHQKSYRMTTKFDGIVLEDLNILGMMKNHCLSKAIGDCAWGEFSRQIRYKLLWKNKVYIEIDRFEPTSKCCSMCHWKNKDLKLKDRFFHCQECGLEIDRDLNAAVNILATGRKILWEAQESVKKTNAYGDKRFMLRQVLVSEVRKRKNDSLIGIAG